MLKEMIRKTTSYLLVCYMKLTSYMKHFLVPVRESRGARLKV